MTPLVLLSLFGIAILIPTFSGDDSDDISEQPEELDETPVVEPITPDTPVVETPTSASLNGTTADDTLTTNTVQAVNGYSGSDTLTADEGADGSTLNGGRDPDTFNLASNEVTANGERGDDTFNITGRGVEANGNSGDDTFNIGGDFATVHGGTGDDIFNDTGDSGDDTITFGGTTAGSYADGGDDNDTLVTRNLGQGVAGSVTGGEGNDTLSVDPENLILNDALQLFGGAGDDVLTNTSGNEDISLNGMDGADTLNVSFDVNDNGDGGTLQGGLGADTFNVEMSIGETSADSISQSDTQIRDFNKDEDVLNLVIDAPADGDYTFGDISIIKDETGQPLGAVSQIRVTFNSTTEGERPIESIISLDGIFELTLDDFIVTMR